MTSLLKCIAICATTFLTVSCNHAQKQLQSLSDSTQVTAQQAAAVNKAIDIINKPEVPVVCYHRIENGRHDEYTVTPALFESQIKLLSDSGYHSILPNQLYDYLTQNKPLPAKPIMFTFDDSRVEHATIAAPVLEKYGFKGVFFIMTITYNKKNYMSKDQLAQLARSGHTVGLHTWDHTMVTKYKEDADWKKEVDDPQAGLAKITGQPVEYLAYPYGINNHNAAVILDKKMKLSFILISKRDSVYPLQTVRRMIIPSWTPQGMLKAIHKTFKKSA